MADMTKRQRVFAALRGEPVDRVPFGFWAHNYARENSAQDLAEESVRLAREFDFDFLKPQSRAQVFAEAWGGIYRASGERTSRPTPVSHVVQDVGGFATLAPVDPTGGSLGEQLEALRLIRAAVGPDTPIVWTVFNPLMICRYLARGDAEMLLAGLRERPDAVHRALRVVAETMAEYARATVASGADGLFYATNLATSGLVTPEEYREFGTRYDEIVLGAVADAPFNVMHVCGDAVHFDLVAEYRVAAFNWALSRDNPTLSEGERRTGRAVVGGVSIKPRDLELTADDVAAEVRAAIADTGGRHFLLGPGCSSSPEKADAIFAAAARAVRATS